MFALAGLLAACAVSSDGIRWAVGPRGRLSGSKSAFAEGDTGSQALFGRTLVRRELGVGNCLGRNIADKTAQIITAQVIRVIRENGEPGHTNIGRGACRSALADGVERRSAAVVLG